jgi:hypothetical protein
MGTSQKYFFFKREKYNNVKPFSNDPAYFNIEWDMIFQKNCVPLSNLDVDVDIWAFDGN